MRNPRFTLRTLSLALLSSSALWLAGCGSSVKLDDQANKGPAPIATANGADAANGANNSSVPSNAVAPIVVSPSDDAANASGLARVVYFDFDSFVVKDEFRGAIDAHARRLNAVKTRKVLIEGHTDERGGREYNLALGQKRAEAVQKSLTLLGVSADQIESVSFGKERPAVQGSTEEAWAQNRRAEIKDR
ncbi:MAG: peptidoglycan-associated lipoprotein Pal [Aquabacterium sp.]|uniref:peptidoglycan-associated lipoprotein Pal n=1 Tax=Aquabacterium sp. TaxID=1872578 RepID=UPI0025E2ABD8|nr:peptidoglycan-associated lipoprotein Pal [uncultured Aquabacterium sp.]